MVDTDVRLHGIETIGGVTSFMKEHVYIISSCTRLAHDGIGSDPARGGYSFAIPILDQCRIMAETVMVLALPVQEIQLDRPTFESYA
jgi:hypothetical protein